jgi:hypothetical protein
LTASRRPVLVAAALLACACSSQNELAAVIVEVSEGVDAGPGLGESAPAGFAVVGSPWSGRWPFAIAVWPLAEGLGAFFAGAGGSEGTRVLVTDDAREPLWLLRREVASGVYGRSPNAVVVRDAAGDLYLVVFADD